MDKELDLPKSAWGPGPWQDEPDRLEWKHRGLPCLMVRNMRVTGGWCGYVAVPSSHRLWEICFSSCPRWYRWLFKNCQKGYCNHTPESVLDTHGGITYSDHCQGDICHE